MGERRGTKGLELWCKKMTEGYPGVKVDNMTTSWRDGLAFCAIIHHFRPDLIDFSKLKKEDVYYNNDLAFRVAKQYLGIPALLEPQDMVECPVPDRLSILTYLSQFYRAFAVTQGPNARIASKRPVQTSPDHGIVSPVSTSPPTKVAHIGAGRIRREPCAKCKLPVFIAERLNVGKLLFHNTCFRCARCDSQLTLVDYYETENNEFCCEICPDEEKTMNAVSKEKLLQKGLSDEEKSASLKAFSNNPDDYSAVFESALEDLQSEGSQYSSARSKFFKTQLDSPSDSGTENEPPDLPDTAPPDFPDPATTDSASAKVDSGFPKVNSTIRLSVDVTKDKSADSSDTSLVRARMRLFESNDIPIKSDLHTVSKTKHSVPIAKLEEINNFDDQFDKKNDIKYTENFEDSENQIKEDLKSSDAASAPIKSHKSITDDARMIEKSEDDGVEAVKTLDDAVNNLIASVTDDTKTAMAANDPVIFIDDDDDVDDKVIETKENASVSKDEQVIEEEPVIILDSSSEVSTADQDVVVVDTTADVIVIEDSPSKSPTSHIPGNPFGDDSEEEQVKLSPPKPSKPSQPEGTSHKTPDDNYPDQLNPFDDENSDDSVETADVPTVPKRSLKPIPSPRFKKKIIATHPSSTEITNPFADDDDTLGSTNAASVKPVPSSRFKKKIIATPPSPMGIVRISINPFENDDEEDEERARKPSERASQPPPSQGFNPFESDDDEVELRPAARRKKSEMVTNRDGFPAENNSLPIPMPRLSRVTAPILETDHKESGSSSLSSKQHYGSNSSISSGSMFGSARKKKPAPRPPILTRNEDSMPHSLNSSPSHSLQHSPRSTPKHRKSKAPPPPSSTPIPSAKTAEAPISDSLNISAIRPSFLSVSTANNDIKDIEPRIDGRDAEKEKIDKDEENRIKQTHTSHIPIIEYPDAFSDRLPPNKSTYGKWKRKKDQAPSLPIPQKRTIKVLPMAEIKRELEMIEKQQQGLERQGVRLEQIIRQKCEGESEEAVANADDIPIEVEDLILQLFELVNEKNELFRKQAELMYLRRQQRLEEEHADVEYQIRCLMLQPESKKTDSDKAREEELIKRLVDIVERRNNIVDCLEMDRIREAEEDDSISSHINLYTTKLEEEEAQKSTSKKDKKKEEKKKKHNKKGKEKDKVDVDKDIDESVSNFGTIEKKKKKFKLNLF